jgi:hypothetical protein
MAMTIDQLASILALQNIQVLEDVAIKMVEINQTKAEWLARSIQVEVMDLDYREMEREDEEFVIDEA